MIERLGRKERKEKKEKMERMWGTRGNLGKTVPLLVFCFPKLKAENHRQNIFFHQ
jgi:hypothetical protein